VSKRHQSSRRKSYGRRQHEVRERTDRGHVPAGIDAGTPGMEEWGPDAATDPFAFLGPRQPRLRFAHGD
jgi:hypothetical protein